MPGGRPCPNVVDTKNMGRTVPNKKRCMYFIGVYNPSDFDLVQSSYQPEESKAGAQKNRPNFGAVFQTLEACSIFGRVDAVYRWCAGARGLYG